MTVVTGPVVDVSGEPLDGVLWAQTSVFRPDGSTVIGPQRVPWPIENGDVEADLAPGPAILSLQFHGHPPHRATVTIPDHDTTLAELLGNPLIGAS